MFQSLRKGKYPSKTMLSQTYAVSLIKFQSLRKGKYPSKVTHCFKWLQAFSRFQSLRKGKYPSKYVLMASHSASTQSFNPWDKGNTLRSHIPQTLRYPLGIVSIPEKREIPFEGVVRKTVDLYWESFNPWEKGNTLRRVWVTTLELILT